MNKFNWLFVRCGCTEQGVRVSEGDGTKGQTGNELFAYAQREGNVYSTHAQARRKGGELGTSRRILGRADTFIFQGIDLYANCPLHLWECRGNPPAIPV